MSQPKQLNQKLIAKCVTYVCGMLLMAGVMFSYSVPAGIFSIGFFAWIDTFASLLIRESRGK